MADEDTIDPERAARAVAAGLAAYPKFQGMSPYLENVKLFRGSQLVVKFKDDRREKGDPDNFAFEKVVVKTYRGQDPKAQ